MHYRRSRFVVTVAIAALMILPMAASAATTSVDITIEETVPVTTGIVDSGSIPGCSAPTVATGPVTANTSGSVTSFAGDKTFTCADGSTIGVAFTVWRWDCAPSNIGWWRVTGGTGVFGGATGAGLLIGTYLSDGTAGTGICGDTGISDRYLGRIRT